MRISIIPADKKIIVDGKTVDLEDDAPWDFDDKTIHAIQWRDGRGELEYEDIPGEEPAPNKIFGDDEFDTIVQPYLDYFNTFLSIYEKKELAAALAEEENLAKQIEELNLDKLEKEAQLVIIEDLQKQNKELRDEREELYNEKSRIEQAKVFDEQAAFMQLEREKIAKQAEIAGLKEQKADEFFEKKSLELAKKYDSLLEDFEKEKEAFIEERKQYQQNLQQQRDLLDRERNDVDELIKENTKEREINNLKLEKDLMDYEEHRMLDKEQLEMERKILDLERDRIRLERLEQEKRIKKLEQDQEFSSIENEQELNARERILQTREEILNETARELKNKFDKVNIVPRYPDGDEKYFEPAEHNAVIDDLRKELEERDETIEKYKSKLLDENFFDTTPLENIESNRKGLEEESIDDILSLLDEIDPQQLYTTLTNNEREDNEFPVNKAIKWFEELKRVIDENNS